MSKRVVQSPVGTVVASTSVLVGRCDHALDPKKRLTIPSEWRAAMGEPDYVYVFPDPVDQCLDLVPKAEMEPRLEKLREKALFDAKVNRALQAIGANSEQLMLDVQGRIRICDKLLAFADLKGTVAMVGSVKMIRLWDPRKLAPEEKVDMADYRSAMQELGF